MTSPHDYISKLNNEELVQFKRMQSEVLKQAPNAELVMSYGMPAFKYKGKVLIHFGAFQDHMSLFPASDEMITNIGPELEAYRTSKGTLQFTSAKPLSEELISKVVSFRLKGIQS